MSEEVPLGLTPFLDNWIRECNPTHYPVDEAVAAQQLEEKRKMKWKQKKSRQRQRKKDQRIASLPSSSAAMQSIQSFVSDVCEATDDLFIPKQFESDSEDENFFVPIQYDYDEGDDEMILPILVK